MSGNASAVRFGTCVGAAVSVLGCLVLSACGASTNAASGTSTSTDKPGASASTQAAGSGSGNSGGAVFSGTITITGSVSVSGSWTDPNEAWPEGCSNWATTNRAGVGPLNVPGPGGPMNATVAGHVVAIAYVLPGYTGPGTFTRGVTNTGLELDGHVYTGPAGYTLVINADGSGSLTFSKEPGALESSSVVSGSETWTCH